MSEPLQIAFATDGIFPHTVGGMQRHSRLLAEHLASTGEVKLTVIHPHKGTQVFDPELGINEIAIEGIDLKKNYLRENYRYSMRVYDALQTLPGHIVYAQGLSVWYKIKEFSDRLIINPHGLEPYQAISTKDKLVAIPFKAIFNRLFNHATHVVSLGGKLSAILDKSIRNQDSIVTLPNATQVPEDSQPRTMPGAQEPFSMLFVSRFAANKGIPVFMEAIQQLNASGLQDQLTFNFAGKGPLYDEYVAKYQLPNVNFLGFVDDADLENLYRTCHLFVLPTLFEGMPTVVLEAMSHRLPIVVSDVGATAEQVDASNGYLIPKNDANALAQAITQFYGLSSEAKRAMSEASFARLQARFTWEAVAQQHLQLFRQMAGHAQPAT